jgi:hypothetical protein
VIIKGKHTDYTYTTGAPIIYATTDTGYDAKGEYIYLAQASRNPLSVLAIIMDYERYYA